MNQIDLKGRRAIVTGGAQGIGHAISERLLQSGAQVLMWDIDAAKMDAACKALGALGPVSGQVVELTDDAAVGAATQAALAGGRIDILVNNAGTTKFADHADLDALSADDFLNIYKVNVVGAFQMVRACAPHLKANDFGRIVNVSSIAGIVGIGSSVAYAASKGALNTMTKSLARALAPEIRVNAVCPGFIGTRWFSERFGPETYARIVEHNKDWTPLHRAATPEDVAEAIAFFCGEGARHITGETLLSDAGHHLTIAGVTRR